MRGDSVRSTRGTDLGLAIVPRIIAAHAGKLEIGRCARQGLPIRAHLPLPVASVDNGASVSKAKAAGKIAD